jgi:signal transduction histidine kinase
LADLINTQPQPRELPTERELLAREKIWQQTQPVRRMPLDALGKASNDPNELSFDLRPRVGLRSLLAANGWSSLVWALVVAAALIAAGEVATLAFNVHPALRWLLGAAAIGVIWLAFSRSLLPLQRDAAQLSSTALDVADGNLAARSGDAATGALAPLAGHIDRMTARMQMLEHTQRATANAISTELRTPLSRMRFSTTYLEDATTDEERSTAVQNLREDLVVMEELVEASLLFTKLTTEAPDLKREAFAIKPWLAKEVDTLRPLGAWVRLKLEMDTINAAAVIPNGDRRLMSLALRNIIRNAQRHGDSTVMVVARMVDGVLQVDIDDDGAGIAEEDRERVFEPFIRLAEPGKKSKSAPGGTGLGLSIARRIARLHGGDVIVEDSLLSGARLRYTVRL